MGAKVPLSFLLPSLDTSERGLQPADVPVNTQALSRCSAPVLDTACGRSRLPIHTVHTEPASLDVHGVSSHTSARLSVCLNFSAMKVAESPFPLVF